MRPPASPHRRAMPPNLNTAGAGASAAAGGGSGKSNLLPMALASPKRKRAETPVQPMAAMESGVGGGMLGVATVSAAASATGGASGAGGAEQLNVSLPHYSGGGGGSIFASGSGGESDRPGINKAASWDMSAAAAAAAAGAAASSFLATSASGGGGAQHHQEDEEEEHMLRLQEGDHPPPTVRKARRRSPGSFTGGQDHAYGYGGGFGVGLDHQNIFMSRALNDGAGGGGSGGRPSTAPAAMTPVRNAAGQDIAAAAHTRQLKASSQSADGLRRGAAGGRTGRGGSHYWTRSKPQPPEAEQHEAEHEAEPEPAEEPQQQQSFLFGQQTGGGSNGQFGSAFGAGAGVAGGMGMFSPGLGGPPAPPPTAVKPPPPGCDELTASTRSTNLSNDSSLLPLGLTPGRPKRGEDSATSIGGDGRLSDVAEGDGSDSGGATVPNSPAAPFRFASFPASLPRVHAHHSRTQPTPAGPVGTDGSRGRARSRIDEAEAWSTVQAALRGGSGPVNSSTVAAGAVNANATAQHSHNLRSTAAAAPAPSGPLRHPPHSPHRRPHSPNTSFEDTLNDSTVSSISIDHHGGQHRNQSHEGPPTVPMHRYTRSDGTGTSSPRGGQWLGDDMENGDMDGDGVSAAAFAAAAAAAAKSHGEDEEIGRTRLDFSSLMSPEPKASARKSIESSATTAKKQQSFASFSRRSFDGAEDAAIGHRIVDEGGVPLTPGAATFRFQLDETKVSPIPNGGGETKPKGTVPPQPLLADTRGTGPASATRRRRVPLSQRKNAPSAAASGSDTVLDTKGNAMVAGDSDLPRSGSKGDLELSAVSGVTSASSEVSATQEDAGESIADASQATNGSTSTKQRKARPMPDMSAFDGGAMEDGSPSSGGDGMVVDPTMSPHGYLGTSGQSGPVPPPSPHKQLICPPTPQRTPVWAAHAQHQEHDDPPQTGAHGGSKRFNIAGAFGPPGQGGGKFKLTRADSLITTKMLAECPPQVLDGLSSLENSLIEDADKSGGSSVAGGGGAAGVPAMSEAETYHDSADLTGSLSASMDDEAMHPPFAPHSSGLGKSTGLSPIGEAGTPGTPGTPGGGLMDYDDTCSAGSGTPRRNLSLMDDMLDEGEGRASASRRSQRASAGSRALERTPLQNRQQEFSASRHISFNSDFENLGQLGSGAFADVYKVRSKADGLHYAIKRNRRQFRGKRDRERALAEVRVMQRLQTCSALQNDAEKGATKSSYCLFLLFFIRAWQEDGYFFCQTELCCRDTCRQLMDSLSTNWNVAKAAYPSILRHLPTPNGIISPGSSDTAGRLVPESTIWKICHDVCAGLSHIHSQGLVHQDVKPSNIFFITHSRLGVLCKIGDFGMAGEIGITEDGEEGDTAYMAPELLSTAPRHASADIFSLGLTIYELACARVGWRLPTDGQRWHNLRDGDHTPDLPPGRSDDLSQLIRKMTNPDADGRPSPSDILDGVHLVRRAGTIVEQFLTDYVKDVDEFDRVKEEEAAIARREAYERRMTPTPPMSALRGSGDTASADRSACVRTPTPGNNTGFHALRS